MLRHGENFKLKIPENLGRYFMLDCQIYCECVNMCNFSSLPDVAIRAGTIMSARDIVPFISYVAKSHDLSDEYALVQRKRSEKIPAAASSGPAAAPFTMRGEAV